MVTVVYLLHNISGGLTVKVVLKINTLSGQHLAKPRRRNAFFQFTAKTTATEQGLYRRQQKTKQA
jgi:hypothetical protein